jgi:hypothetical protein
VIGGKPIAVLLQSISDVSAIKCNLCHVTNKDISFFLSINPLVTFYDIHGRKREVLFFYFVMDSTRDLVNLFN